MALRYSTSRKFRPTAAACVYSRSARHPDGIRVSDRVAALLATESKAGLSTAKGYQGFQQRAEKIKDDFVSFLIEAKRQGKRVAGYGAAAKGNTLLNFSGCRRDLISLCRRSQSGQARQVPSRQPHSRLWARIVLYREKPDYVIILPWNLKAEVMHQLKEAGVSAARFVTAVPDLQIV